VRVVWLGREIGRGSHARNASARDSAGFPDQGWHEYLLKLLADPLGFNLCNSISHGLHGRIGPVGASLLVQAALLLAGLSLGESRETPIPRLGRAPLERRSRRYKFAAILLQQRGVVFRCCPSSLHPRGRVSARDSPAHGRRYRACDGSCPQHSESVACAYAFTDGGEGRAADRAVCARGAFGSRDGAFLYRCWLRKPVPALAESKPIDVIASGDYVRVAELVSALEEASFS
jgi:hypothetical protein